MGSEFMISSFNG